MSIGAKIGIALLVVAIAATTAVVAYASWALGSDDVDDDTVVVLTITGGTTAAGIGAALAEHEVIRSETAFRMRARSRGLDRRLQAGEYEFRRGMTVDETIAVFLAGPRLPDGMRFTIPEGLTVAETIERLAEQTPHSVEDYRAVLDERALELPDWVPDPDSFGEDVREPYEGLLSPETYEVSEDASAQQILQRMVNQLARIYDSIPSDWHESASQWGLSRYEMLVLASLVERETQVREELGTISGVIRNRLEAGFRLELDASLLYAAEARGVRVGPEIRRIDSPYNLYEVDGLPPTPIGGVGRRALEAAYNPEDHDYLYFVKRDEDGNHAFAETFEEHQSNVRRFRELQREAEESQSSPTPSP